MAARTETIVAAGAGLAAVGAVGISVLAFGLMPGANAALSTAWWVAYAAYVGIYLFDPDLIRVRPPWSPKIGIGLLMLAGLAVWFAGPQLGWSAILFVVTASVAAYVLTPPALAVIVVVQTTAVIVGGAMIGGSTPNVAFTGLAYLTFQAFAVVVVLSLRRQGEARAELAAAHTELRATSALLESTSRSAERVRIARELHDVVGHQLTALALELEVATHSPAGPAREHVVRARDLTKNLLGDVRGAVGELRETPEDLTTVLRGIVTGLPGLDVRLDVDLPDGVGEPARTTLVRCVQEAVTNTLRHAGASRLIVSLTADADGAVLVAEDDGVGTAHVVRGAGLSGMFERLTELGGHLDLASAPGRGFTVTARVPLR